MAPGTLQRARLRPRCGSEEAVQSRRRSFEGHVLEHGYHSFTHRLERLVTQTQRVLEQLAMIVAPEMQDPREGEDALLDREIWLTVPLVFDVSAKEYGWVSP